MTTKNSNVLLSQIHAARNVTIALAQRQGYNVDDYKYVGINEVNSMEQNNQLDMLVENPETKRKLYIHHFLNKKLNVNNLRDIVDELFRLEETLTASDTLFIVVKDDINDSIITELVHVWETDGIFIVVESLRRLQFNILEHSLVPKHEIISDVNAIMKRHNLTDMEQFPEISRFDPVARAIGIRPGQVCRIIRPSKTAVTTEYYRVCV